MSNCCPVTVQAVAGPVGPPGGLGFTGPTGPAEPFFGNLTLSIEANSDAGFAAAPTSLDRLAIGFTFPTVGGPWRVLASYNTLWTSTTAGPIDGYVIDTNNGFRFAYSQVYASAGDSGSNSGFAVSTRTYQNGEFVVFVSRLLTSNTGTATLQPATTNKTATTFLTITALPAGV